jgi:Polysaccharide biosynthesis protein
MGGSVEHSECPYRTAQVTGFSNALIKQGLRSEDNTLSAAQTKPDASDVVPTSGSSQPDSYGQIFKSTAVIASASIINVLLGAVRTKFLAVYLGPSGVGLVGLYTSIVGMASTLAEMGVGSSGVRRIAEAFAANNELTITRTITVLHRVSTMLG